MSSRDPPRVSSEGSRVTLWVVTDFARPADRKPAPLARGDGVAIVAPASPFERERFERGLAALWKIGLEPRFSEGLFAKHPPETGHLAGDDERRIEELRIAFTDPSAKALVLARGGYGALRLRLGTQEVPEKLIVGYSDATVLHELWARAGVPSIHGPMCTQLGEEPSALGRLEALLLGQATGELSWQPSYARGGRVEATLRGGNLATLASLCGTPLQPQYAGCLVLLEDLNEPPYRLDRLLTQLLLAGAFDGARGFVIGDLVAPGEPLAGRPEVVAERLGKLGVPIVFGAPFGHAGRNQPVALGVPHALDAERGTLTPLAFPTR